MIVILSPGAAEAQDIRRAKLSDKVIVESGPATQVSEKVRAGAPGVLVEVLVRAGDKVKKGQLLGNTDLSATKYQLDLAREAMIDNSTLLAMKGNADAWTATRVETEEALRKRNVEKTRLEWARGMEKFHHSSYEAQLEKKKVQRIQYNYWKDQYESRFFRAPVDGTVTQVLLDVGNPVNYATHVFTIGDHQSYLVPLSVPAEYAAMARPDTTLPVRVCNGKHVARSVVNHVTDDPKSPGRKIITLLINSRDFPAATGGNLSGAKFDVLMSQAEPVSHETGSLDLPARDNADGLTAARY